MLNFDKLITPVYTRHVWLYDRGDYQSFSRDLDNTDWSSLKNDDLDTYTNNITECITKLATKHIPNKDIKVRKSDPPWLTTNIKRLMRKRKRCMINIKEQITRLILRHTKMLAIK